MAVPFPWGHEVRIYTPKDIGCRFCGTISRWQSEENELWNAIFISYQLSLMLIIQLAVWAQCIWSSEGLYWSDNIWSYYNTSKVGATPRVVILFFSYDIVCHWLNAMSLLHGLMWSRKWQDNVKVLHIALDLGSRYVLLKTEMLLFLYLEQFNK